MPSRINPAAFSNAFAQQVQLGASMRASDQAEESNALSLEHMRRQNEAEKQPKYDAEAFQRVGGIAAQISQLPDPMQKRAAFKQAILGNAPAFDALGMPHTDALAKLDQTDDATLDATLAKLAGFAPKAAPQDVAPGHSLVRPNAAGGYDTTFTAPTEAKGTDDITEWKVAQSQGYKGGFLQYMKEVKAAGAPQMTPPSGFHWNPDGSLAPIKGGPQDPTVPKPPGEADKQKGVLFDSMLNAEKGLASLSTDNATTGSAWQALLGSNPVTRPMQSDSYREYEAGALRFAANLLYIKSGATAPPEEVRSTYKQLFPQVGDGPKVIAQKNAARLQELRSVAGRYNFDASQIPGAPGGGGGGGPPPAAPNGQPVRVNSRAEALALPPGTSFVTPDGRVKVVPNKVGP